jgi:uncharacterized protein (TIGR00369 family)
MEFPVRIPFVAHLGVQLDHMADGHAVLLLDPQAEHHNSFDVVHGGVSMTLLDVVMAHAARSVSPDMGAVTIELKTSFMRPALGALRAEGNLLHRTATMAFTEGRVVDAKGQVCAHATGTFKYVKRLPVGAKQAHDLNAN